MDTFNNTSTELNDWLSLLDHMITQRVRVGDLNEISDLTVKLKVSAVNHFYSIYFCAITNLYMKQYHQTCFNYSVLFDLKGSVLFIMPLSFVRSKMYSLP